MKKEVLLAIILGLVVGLVIAFGIYNARKAVLNFQQTSTQSSPTTEDQQPETSVMTISTPIDHSIQQSLTTTLLGTTYPKSNIAAIVQETPVFGTSDERGAFSLPLALNAGSNVITVVSIDPQGKTETATRLVVVSSANLDDTPIATPSSSPKTSPSPTASSSGAAVVQQNIKDRIEKVIEGKKSEQPERQPLAYIGTIERVTTMTLTLKSMEETKIVQLSDKTSIVESISQRPIKPEDVVVGSFAIVMGYTQDNTFDARRIVLSNESLYPRPLLVVAGTLQSWTRTMLNMLNRAGKEVSFVLGKTVSYQDMNGRKLTKTDVSLGDSLLVVLDATKQASPSAILLHNLSVNVSTDAATKNR